MNGIQEIRYANRLAARKADAVRIRDGVRDSAAKAQAHLKRLRSPGHQAECRKLAGV